MITTQTHTTQTPMTETPDGQESPNPISPKQLAANARNATRSTGPRTAEGKAAVSGNAVKHGLCSQRTLIPGEDPKRFAALREGIMTDVRPTGDTEYVLVERIATAAWRLKRATRYETSLIEDAMACAAQAMSDTGAAASDPPGRNGLEAIGARGIALALGGAGFRTLTRYESGIERGMFRAIKELRSLRKNGDGLAFSGADPTALIEAQIEADLQQFKREEAEFEAAMEELELPAASGPQVPRRSPRSQTAKQSHFAARPTQDIADKDIARNPAPANRPAGGGDAPGGMDIEGRNMPSLAAPPAQ